MILFFNHQQRRCGVYQMGRRIGHTLRDLLGVHYVEAVDPRNAINTVNTTKPSAIVYNWHPSTLPWAVQLVRRFSAIKHIGLMHEISPESPIVGSDIFPYRMVCDPSFPTDGRSIFRSVRHVPRYVEKHPINNHSIIVGSFGFAVGGKMFATIVHAVGAEFPGALVRLRIPHAFYGDDRGDLASVASAAARAVTVGGVCVEVFHEFLDETSLVRWLAGNDFNVFFYEPNGDRGIASAIDYAIAAQKPIAINGSQMFRHVRERFGCYPTVNLRQSLEKSGEIVNDLYTTWSPERLAHDYKEMFGQLGVS